MIQPIPDIEEPSGQEGAELSKIPVDLKSGDWSLKNVPWIGGHIISMTHLPSAIYASQSPVRIVIYSNILL